MLGKSRRNKLSNHFYEKANIGNTPHLWMQFQLVLQHRKAAQAAIKIMDVDLSREQRDVLDRITTGAGGTLNYVPKFYIKPLFKGWKGILRGHQYTIRSQEEFVQVVKQGTEYRNILRGFKRGLDDLTPPYITTIDITYIKNNGSSGFAKIIVGYSNKERIKNNRAIIKWIGQHIYKHIPEDKVAGASRWSMPEVIVEVGKGTLKYKFSN